MNLRDKSVVVMPAALRPEFCALALEQLGKARHCPTIFVNVDSVGEELVKEFEYVFLNYFPKTTGGTMSVRDPHTLVTSGCWNILESIRDGYNVGAEYVFLVEEDVLVTPDFFEYHWEMMNRRIGGSVDPVYKVSCGRRCRQLFPRAPWMYTNPGSCLSRELISALLPHVNNEFYNDPGRYMDRVFGPVDGIRGLDDGLIRHTLWKNKWDCAYPPMEEPRCAHVGFMAYENRMDFLNLGIADGIQARIDKLRYILKYVDPTGPKAKYLRDLDPFPVGLL